MKSKWTLFGLVLFLFATGRPQSNPVDCLIHTSLGDIAITVYPDQAPVTVANFLRYVDERRYDNSTFFRVVTLDNQPDNEVKIEVIQGGDIPEEQCFPAISHETTQQTGVKHTHGTISMARGAPGTASCNFFICIHDQPELDFGGKRNPDGLGFAAFGKVTTGMEVVERIQQQAAHGQRLKEPVAIISIRRIALPPGKHP